MLGRPVGRVAVAGALAFALAAPAASAADTDLFTWLSGTRAFPRAAGNAEYERSATDRELEVTVSNVKRLAGKRIVVYVSRVKVGTMVVSRAGRAHREWKSERGQHVPYASAGSLLRVRPPGGGLIVSGRFRIDVGD